MSITVARVENSWSYVDQNGVEMTFEECTLGKFKGKTFAITDGKATEIEVTEFTDQPRYFGNGTVRIVREIEIIGKALPYKEVFFNMARQTKFYIDESETEYVGYTFNRHWNGWECPMFTREVAEDVCEEFCDGEYFGWRYDEAKDTFYIKDLSEDEYEEEKYEGFDIQTENGTIHVYDIGSYAWIWSEV